MTVSIVRPWECIETFQGTQFYQLYRSPPSALAIFRKRLPSLAKSLVMALLCISRPLPKRDLELFVKTSSTTEYQRALQTLQQYHIVKVVKVRSTDAYSLTPDFATSLRQVLVGAGASYTFRQTAGVPPEGSVSAVELDKYSRQQLENILGYIVGSAGVVEPTNQISPPPQAVIDLLKVGNLIAFSDSHGHILGPEITQTGFSFVLQDVETQLWALIFLYIRNTAAQGFDEVDVLSFIFLISSLDQGSAYSSTNLDESQQQALTILSTLGVVYQAGPAINNLAGYYYPTRLATTLSSEVGTNTPITDNTPGISSPSSRSDPARGFIIIETNCRVYAYTSSPVQIALLSLFVNLRSRHPNLVTGKITQNSIRRAVQRGISAQQIVSYLSSHAHPQMRAGQAQQQGRSSQSSTLPATIVDQIRLWQLERDRITATSGFLLKDFEYLEDYKVACTRANDHGILVWRSDSTRMFFVNLTTVDGLESFIRNEEQ